MIESRLLEKEDEGAKELIEKARQTGSDEALKNALAAFYLKSGTADNSVEFFHKSFGEFLCAERMAETLEEWTQETEKRRKTSYTINAKELDRQIYDLFGYGNLTAEIVEYLMALLIKNEIDFAVLFERLHEFYLRWCNGDFIELWDTSDENLPLKKAQQLQQQDIERGQRQVDIYTGLNVMILLFELHRYGQSQEELKEKLHFYPCGKPGSEEFDKQRLLRIIGYADSLKVYAFLGIIGQFLSYADLRSADLRSADLSGADLRSADLRSADLSGANLRSADLRSANLRSADLRSADLSGANLSYANLRSADLSYANLRSADLSGANLSDANLSGANLSGANLSGANLSGANLSGANLSGADLRSADLRSADLSYANLRSADLRSADLSGANLSGANLSYANLSYADLSYADLSGANLSGANLSGANLSGANLSRANLSGANLSGADLRSADLRSADLRSADLSRADLRSADLRSADLRSADLRSADLSDIRWDNHTKWSNVVGLEEAKNVPEKLKQQS
jgi:uncharacterized protein YjbI with pentapeptide repeats